MVEIIIFAEQSVEPMKRRFLLYILLALLPVMSSCHKEIWDKLNDHEARIARLEALCNQYNTTINSLQVLLSSMQSNNWIKDVIPVSENGLTIGYVVTFMHGDPITIYNGQNGQDGRTPIIGVKQDVDGIWYWTLDDDWLLNTEGKKVPAQAQVPKLKIEEDYWWVSYDNGNTWSKLSKAINESSGDSMFQEVRQDDKFVYFVLTNGQTITIQKSGGLTWEYV